MSVLLACAAAVALPVLRPRDDWCPSCLRGAAVPMRRSAPLLLQSVCSHHIVRREGSSARLKWRWRLGILKAERSVRGDSVPLIFPRLPVALCGCCPSFPCTTIILHLWVRRLSRRLRCRGVPCCSRLFLNSIGVLLPPALPPVFQAVSLLLLPLVTFRYRLCF